MKKFSPKDAATTALALSLLGTTVMFSQAAEVKNATVAFLMPDQASTRYEQHDYPGFAAEMKKLCDSCKVIYQNASADAARQQQQFNSVISQGAKVIVLDPVDSTAAASLVKMAQSQGIKVIAYDRPVPDARVDFYVSFDNEAIGKAISESLIKHLKAAKITAGSKEPGKISAGEIKRSALSAIAEQKMKDLNANDIEAATRIIEGSARAMGLTVVEG